MTVAESVKRWCNYPDTPRLIQRKQKVFRPEIARLIGQAMRISISSKTGNVCSFWVENLSPRKIAEIRELI